MKTDAWLVTFVIVFVLGCACLPAFADMIVYSTDFSSDPGWDTDQPLNYYWNEPMESYFVHNINTYPDPDYYPNRYAGKTMAQPVGSFELRWDINVSRCDWSAGLYFGIWDSSLREPGWGYGGEFIMAVIGRADAGHCINLEVAANGLIAEASTYPGWSLSKWYTFKISYDSDAEVANLEVLDRATAESIWTTSLAVPGGGFTRDLVFLGSNLGMVGLHGYSGISQFAVLEANLDNVVLSIPELAVSIDIKPGSCPNPLNVKSKGVLPVAILGTEDFDVSEVDWAGFGCAAPVMFKYEDVATPVGEESDECECTEVGPDGYLDLVLYFDAQEIVVAIGDIEDGEVLSLTLNGFLDNGTPIEGSDCIIIREKGKND